MKTHWHVHEEGLYYRELRLIDDATKRVIGTVSGSIRDREWFGFNETPKGAERLGKYADESSAKAAVEAATLTASALCKKMRGEKP